jgi:hypothetical protein
MARMTGLWVYQTLDAGPPDPRAVLRRAKRHGHRWVTAQAIARDELLDVEWLEAMRRAATAQGLRLAVHGYVGRPMPRPRVEAALMAKAIDVAQADFAIVNAEIEYERSAAPDSQTFVSAYRRLKPRFPSFLSSFGRPSFHADLDWQAWADGGFRGMPQAYENLNAAELTPAQCVRDWARFFARDKIHVTLGCFSEAGHGHLPLARLLQSVRDVPRLPFNVYRHGTVTTAELEALAGLG